MTRPTLLVCAGFALLTGAGFAVPGTAGAALVAAAWMWFVAGLRWVGRRQLRGRADHPRRSLPARAERAGSAWLIVPALVPMTIALLLPGDQWWLTLSGLTAGVTLSARWDRRRVASPEPPAPRPDRRQPA